jgi:hypothetical protein
MWFEEAKDERSGDEDVLIPGWSESPRYAVAIVLH